MKEINLSKGLKTKVDDSDFDFLNQWKWTAGFSRGKYYACRYDRTGGKPVKISMHRLLLGMESGNKMCGDHIDCDSLNNTRINLRVVTRRQNSINRKSWKNSRSAYLGVNFHQGTKMWTARIQTVDKRLSLGYFDTEFEAALAYNAAAIIHHKQYAQLNKFDL